MRPGAISCRQCSGKNEHRSNESNGGCGTDGRGKLADELVDHIKRILHANAGDRWIGVGDGT